MDTQRVHEPGMVTRRPSQCISPVTTTASSSVGCGDEHDPDSSRSHLHAPDPYGDQFASDFGLTYGDESSEACTTVIDTDNDALPRQPSVCFGPRSPPHGKHSLANSSSSTHSDQSDDITTAGSTTTTATTPTKTDSNKGATSLVNKVAMPPRPIDFPTMESAVTAPPFLSASTDDGHSNSIYWNPLSRVVDGGGGPGYLTEWNARTPPVTYQTSKSLLHTPGGAGTSTSTSGARPWSVSAHSTPTSHNVSGFPHTNSPMAWCAEAQGSPTSSSSFHVNDGTGLETPSSTQNLRAGSSIYSNGYPTATSPNAHDARRGGCSPVGAPSRHGLHYDPDRFSDSASVDAAPPLPPSPSGYGWSNTQPFRDVTSRSRLAGGGAAAAPSYIPSGFTPGSVYDDGQSSDGQAWGSEFPAGYYSGSSYGGHYSSPAAPVSPVLGRGTSPLYGPVSPSVPYAASQQSAARMSALSLPVSADVTAVPERTSIVARLDVLAHVCQRILRDAANAAHSESEEDWCYQSVALDLEGRDLGRHGSICIITLATVDCVYLVDMVELGAAALAPGSPLRRVLEAPHVTKLMYDCRADCDALFFLYNVRLVSVCDLQASACYGLFPNSRHLPGMKDAFQRLGVLGDAERGIKEAGKTLFDPKSGGSFEHWEVRPLEPLLAKYCAVDVKYFFMARTLLWPYTSAGYEVGQARIAQVCDGRFEGCCKGNALRDFA